MCSVVCVVWCVVCVVRYGVVWCVVRCVVWWVVGHARCGVVRCVLVWLGLVCGVCHSPTVG